MDPGPPPRRPLQQLAGLPGLWSALRTLGFVGPAPGRGERLDHCEADDGHVIPVRVLGAGPPVMLVHGLGCSHRHWMPVARRLARRHRVYTWDARGHGQCRPLHATPVTLARLALDLQRLLDHFELPQAALVGHSMGAMTVMRYLQDHGTARVAAVGIVDQSPRVVTDAEWRCGLFGGCSDAMLHGLIAGARRDLADTVLRELQAAAPWLHDRLLPKAALGRWLRAWLGHVDAVALLDLAESLVEADFRATLARLDVPFWIVLGGRSAHYAGVPLGDWYRATIPHAALATYERSGHSPHVGEPGRFARELLRFLQVHG